MDDDKKIENNEHSKNNRKTSMLSNIFTYLIFFFCMVTIKTVIRNFLFHGQYSFAYFIGTLIGTSLSPFVHLAFLLGLGTYKFISSSPSFDLKINSFAKGGIVGAVMQTLLQLIMVGNMISNGVDYPVIYSVVNIFLVALLAAVLGKVIGARK